MNKTTFTSGISDKPNFKITIETFDHNFSDSDLQEYIARYFSRHGGMRWSVVKE